MESHCSFDLRFGLEKIHCIGIHIEMTLVIIKS
jgi:hypothetical protein